MADSDVIRFNDTQMTSLFSYAGYSKYVADAADATIDGAYIHDWRALNTASEVMSLDNDMSLFYQDAFEVCVQFSNDILKYGVSTADVHAWVALRDAITCAARLSLDPAFDGGGGTTVDTVIQQMAALLDIFARAADRDLRATATPAQTEKEQHRRIARIYSDIICGRVSAWLFYINMMGREAAFIAGVDWVAACDEYANLRAQSYCKALVDNLDGIDDIDAAGKLFGRHATMAAMAYDRIQSELYSAILPAGYARNVDLLNQAILDDVANLASGCLTPIMTPGEDMVGYGKTFGYATVASIVMLPLDVENAMRQTYIPIAKQFKELIDKAQEARQ